MMKLSDSGQRVFDARYAERNEKGEIIESFEQAVSRLARTAASAEKKENQNKWEEKFSQVIGELLFVPSTPIWANMGKTDRPWQPGACFVLGLKDSLHSMYETLYNTAMIFKSGGGTGYNFSTIRPGGDLVRSTKGKASGVVELLKLYNASAEMVMQGGVRRGASMAILNIEHPEIMDFINSKLDGGLTNFNISVGITNSFMKALSEDAEWPLKFNGRVYDVVQALDLWNMIINAAHACGDPGIVFLDRLQQDNPVPEKVIDATNPCGEQPLSPGESCLLGSINFARMVDDDGTVNWDLIEDVVYTAIRFLDNLIDVAEYPLPFVEQETKATRKVGLGYTALHDALIKARLPYDSEEGRQFASRLAKSVQDAAHWASQELGEEKGVFPDWEKSVYFKSDEKRRNAATTTIAPTGSVTAMAGCEGYGIEPIFAIAYSKETNVAGSFEVFSPLFLDACKEYNIPREVLSEVAKKGTCQGIKGIPEDIARVFKGAQDIAPEDHILMQATIQNQVDNAVSKTINLPNTATVEDVGHCYCRAFELGLKGITVFRDGCKKGTITVGEKKQQENVTLKRGDILPRSDSAMGVTHRLDSGCGKIYLTVNYRPDNGEILETFITTGSDGGCLVYTEATSRLVSLAIRGGISVEKIIEQLQSTHSCPAYQMARGKGKKVSPGKSCASAIAKKLGEVKKQLASKCNGGRYVADLTKPVVRNNEGTRMFNCEICGLKMERAEGCFVCRNCGFSKC